MSGCFFDWGEGFCDYEGKCKFQKGIYKECTATPKDLVERCPDCWGIIDEYGDCKCWKGEEPPKNG